jgi:hypothetical protein
VRTRTRDGLDSCAPKYGVACIGLVPSSMCAAGAAGVHMCDRHGKIMRLWVCLPSKQLLERAVFALLAHLCLQRTG